MEKEWIHSISYNPLKSCSLAVPRVGGGGGGGGVGEGGGSMYKKMFYLLHQNTWILINGF